MDVIAKDSEDARNTAQDPILQLLADRIRAAMESEGETYRSLAQRAGVSSGTVSNLLASKDTQLLTFLRVVAALGYPNLESVFGDIQLPTQSLLEDIAAAQGSTPASRKPDVLEVDR